MVHVIDLHFLGYQHAIAAFLVETDDGPVLIETGPHATFKQMEKGIQAVGYQLQDIQHVLLTHIHFDHAGAAWALAALGARIYVHPLGARHLAHPEKLLESAKRIYQDDMDRLWGDMQPIPETQLTAIEHSSEVKVGNTTFKAWHTPGHAVHHIAWQVGDELFTGDVAGVRINGGLVEPPCPPPDINLEAWQNSIALMRSLPVNTLYLTHFGKVYNPSEHLDELERRLTDWANWVKTPWEQGQSPEEVVPAFQQYVAGQLRSEGADAHTIQQYEAANPSWMSVAGLMRYWKKKSESTA